MEVLKNSEKIFQQFFNKQKVFNGKYRFLSYVFISNYDNNYFLFNNLTKKIIIITQSEYDDIFTNNNKILVKQLIEDWFLVANDFNDFELYTNYITFLNGFQRDNGINFYKILTTNDCNARCFYCYKKDVDPVYMSNEVAEKLASFIISKHKSKVHLYWFGGEPLLNQEPIDIITDKLRMNNIEYHSSMITNGYLLNDNILQRAIQNWNLKFIQITLDGTSNVYKKIKAYTNNDPNPFETVISNIDRLKGTDVRTFLRINMDSYNSYDVTELSELLTSRYKDDNNIFIYPKLLSDYSINTHKDKTDLVSKFVEFKKEIFANYKLPFERAFFNTKISACMADDSSSLVVLPNGDFCKCDNNVEESVFSNIFNHHEINSEILQSWQERRLDNDECHRCVFWPSCYELKNCHRVWNHCDANERNLKKISIELALINLYKKSRLNNEM